MRDKPRRRFDFNTVEITINNDITFFVPRELFCRINNILRGMKIIFFRSFEKFGNNRLFRIHFAFRHHCSISNEIYIRLFIRNHDTSLRRDEFKSIAHKSGSELFKFFFRDTVVVEGFFKHISEGWKFDISGRSIIDIDGPVG